jgi:hypothetical protein
MASNRPPIPALTCDDVLQAVTERDVRSDPPRRAVGPSIDGERRSASFVSVLTWPNGLTTGHSGTGP